MHFALIVSGICTIVERLYSELNVQKVPLWKSFVASLYVSLGSIYVIHIYTLLNIISGLMAIISDNKSTGTSVKFKEVCAGFQVL